ncbi:sensor domain-containing diguanylate cyclase [Cytobacillus gottheilii]|uniref:sensor domain-containing diguanylate cyclase n=1 Tax=Cytobacillus gottheilii TaxID=859144 RepID=UPI0009BC6492|nr:sensor domain-containing diguanylate cyclase [Cytobacillus gottheilii]
MGLTINLHFVTGFLIALILGIIINIFVYRRSKREQQSLTEEHNRFVHLIETPNDFIYYAKVIPEVKFEYLSPSAENFFGENSIARAYASSNIAFIDIHPDDYKILMKKVRGDIDYSKPIIQRWKDKDGTYRWFEEYATPVYNKGKLTALQGVLRNIDERIALQEKLDYQLYHDALTGIYNRAYFEMIFTKYNEEVNTTLAIILCDLDDLKFVNDNYGHKQGDLLIKKAAELLNAFSSQTITVARIGGDEFILFAEGKNEQEIDCLLERIEDKIEHYNYESMLKVKLSVGHAFTESSKGKLGNLFTQADGNMYVVKSKRKALDAVGTK